MSINGLSKVLLINPPFVQYGGVEGHGGKNSPLNLAYLAAYLRKELDGLEVAIIDAEGLELPLERVEEQVDRFSPDIIGITVPTPVFYVVEKLCRRLKAKDSTVPIVLGGPHPTALPEQTLLDTEADIAVIGEGEQTFLELVKALGDGQDLAEVAGLAYRQGHQVRVNQRRPVITDLDSLPFPAKDLLPLEKYYLPPTKRIRSERATNMITSRGCPFACNFCMARQAWGRMVRYRSTESVLTEIRQNVEHWGLDEFSFHDELFTAKPRRTIEVCKAIVDQGLDISWVCQARAGTVTPEMLTWMKRAGCGKIAFGFESGSQRMLGLMNKKETLAHALESVRLCKEADVDVVGAFILGYPGEDLKSIQQTMDFAIKLDCDTVSFFIAIPYPGTPLYDEAVSKGYIPEKPDWREFAPVSQHESPMDIPGFSKNELAAWKRKAYRRFYLRPRYLWRRLSGMRSKADVLNALRGLAIFRRVTS